MTNSQLTQRSSSINSQVARTLWQAAFFSLLLAFGACTTDSNAQSRRGQLGKADLVGSCSLNDCGDIAAEGTCYCDEQCADFGDCCDNAESVCELNLCDACLANGGTWQPEAQTCTSNCDIEDISCFTDSCPEVTEPELCEASCEAGEAQVATESGCLQDDAVCYSLDNCGTEIWCTGPQACEASCADGEAEVASSSECLQDDAVCYEVQECDESIWCTGPQ